LEGDIITTIDGDKKQKKEKLKKKRNVLAE
jgi:hypothetical protein